MKLTTILIMKREHEDSGCDLEVWKKVTAEGETVLAIGSGASWHYPQIQVPASQVPALIKMLDGAMAAKLPSDL